MKKREKGSYVPTHETNRMNNGGVTSSLRGARAKEELNQELRRGSLEDSEKFFNFFFLGGSEIPFPVSLGNSFKYHTREVLIAYKHSLLSKDHYDSELNGAIFFFKRFLLRMAVCKIVMKCRETLCHNAVLIMKDIPLTL